MSAEDLDLKTSGGAKLSPGKCAFLKVCTMPVCAFSPRLVYVQEVFADYLKKNAIVTDGYGAAEATIIHNAGASFASLAIDRCTSVRR